MSADISGVGRLAVIALIVGEASGVFAGFCPSWFTVASPFFHEQEAREGNIRRIRWGETAATIIVLLTGAAMSYIGRDPIPLIASLVISAVFIYGYEYQIAHPSSEDGGKSATFDPQIAQATSAQFTAPIAPAGAAPEVGFYRAAL